MTCLACILGARHCYISAPSEPHLAAHSPVKEAVENVLQEGNSYHLSPSQPICK